MLKSIGEEQEMLGIIRKRKMKWLGQEKRQSNDVCNGRNVIWKEVGRKENVPVGR